MSKGIKISVYSAKGGEGKTPIATNIALDRGYALATNEAFHVFTDFIPEDLLLALKPNEAFPEIPDEISVVFDLAGSITENSISIISALKQSDIVIIPISNEVKALNAGIGTIREVKQFTDNILVVASKLDKDKKDIFSDDWTKSSSFINIQNQVKANIDFDVTILPLKRSKVFDMIFESEMSIKKIMKTSPLANYNYRSVSTQFEEIYKYIDEVK